MNPWEMKFQKVGTEVPTSSATANPWEMSFQKADPTSNAQFGTAGEDGGIFGLELPKDLPAGPQPGDHSWTQLPGMIGNAVMHPVQTAENLGQGIASTVQAIPGDAGQFVANMYNGITSAPGAVVNAFLHPKRTLVALQPNGLDAALYGGPSAVTKAPIGQAILNTAGTPEALERTITQHPVQTAALLATGLTGSGDMLDAFVPGSKIAQGLKTAGNVVNPINAPANILRTASRLPGVAGIPAQFALDMGGAAKTMATNAFLNAGNKTARIVVNALGDKGPQVLSALRNTAVHQIVPGSLPTPADVLAGAGVNATGVAGLQDTLSRLNDARVRDLYSDRAEANNAARLALINSLDPVPSLQDAVNQAVEKSNRRYAVSDNVMVGPVREPAYGVGRAGVSQGGPAMDPVTGQPITNPSVVNPYTLNTLQDAQPVMRPGGAPMFKITNNGFAYTPEFSALLQHPAIVKAINDAAEDMANGPTPLFDRKGMMSGEGMKTIKQNLDTQQANASSPQSADIRNAQKIGSAKQAFVNWAYQNNPAYQVANEYHAAMRQPIVQSAVTQQLAGKLTPTTGEGTAVQRAASYLNALNNPEGVINAAGKVIGRMAQKPEAENILATRYDQVYSPEDMEKLNAVRDDIVRQRQAAWMAHEGPSGLQVQGNDLDIPWPSPKGIVLHTAREIAKALGGKISPEAAAQLAAEFLNPSSAADRIEDSLNRVAQRQAALDQIKSVGNALAVPLRYPAVYNALGASNQQQQQPVNAFNAR